MAHHNTTTHLINESNHLILENQLLRDQNAQLLREKETLTRLAKDLSEQVSECQGIAVMRKAS